MRKIWAKSGLQQYSVLITLKFACSAIVRQRSRRLCQRGGSLLGLRAGTLRTRLADPGKISFRQILGMNPASAIAGVSTPRNRSHDLSASATIKLRNMLHRRLRRHRLEAGPRLEYSLAPTPTTTNLHHPYPVSSEASIHASFYRCAIRSDALREGRFAARL